MTRAFTSLILWALLTLTALAQSPLSTLGAGSGRSGTVAPVTVELALAGSADASNLTSYDFLASPFGADAVNRRIVVVILGNSAGNTSFSSVSIGDATDETQAVANGANTRPVAIYVGDPTGTSGTINVTFTGAMQNCTISVYRLLGAGSAVPFDATQDFDVADTSISEGITTPLNGAEIFGAYIGAELQSIGFNATTDVQIINEPTGDRFASRWSLNSGGSSITLTTGPSASALGIWGASWGP